MYMLTDTKTLKKKIVLFTLLERYVNALYMYMYLDIVTKFNLIARIVNLKNDFSL